MRRSSSAIGAKLPLYSPQTLMTPFSSFSGDGSGRGRSSPSFSRFTSDPDSESPAEPPPGAAGHGRGQVSKPLFSSFISLVESGPLAGRGRGRGLSPFSPPPPLNQSLTADPNPDFPPAAGRGGPSPSLSPPQPYEEVNRHIRRPRPPFRQQPRYDDASKFDDSEFDSPRPGAGRGGGGLAKPPASQEVNRHAMRRSSPPPPPYSSQEEEPMVDYPRHGGDEGGFYGDDDHQGLEDEMRMRMRPKTYRPKMSIEEAVKHFVEVFAKAASEAGVSATATAASGRGWGRGRGRGRGMVVEKTSKWAELYVGDDADGEKLLAKVGREMFMKLNEGFDEVVAKVLPSPLDEAHLGALDLKYRLEFEPEFLMGDLDRNPDIEEKEPIPLRDVLEKVKPFLMEYEGIESEEEWEEIINETMERVPELKRIVDHYSGKTRVTAKKQHEILKGIAQKVPASLPDSMKQFTDRAVLTLQSNPGWKFHQKQEFMREVVGSFKNAE